MLADMAIFFSWIQNMYCIWSLLNFFHVLFMYMAVFFNGTLWGAAICSENGVGILQLRGITGYSSCQCSEQNS
jgi:hypothetical protein